jgi:nanoRNase/pAp phosphatase (c-di-AMP/oligoRNAs hydrolase)
VIDNSSAICFYTSFLLDVKYFKPNSLTKEVFDVSSDIIADDIDISEISYNINQRKSLSSLRILGSTLKGLRLHCDGELSTMVVTKESIRGSGARYSDLLEVLNYGISLVTVKISILLIEWDSSVHIYLKGKKDIDVLSLALKYGGTGDRGASNFEIKIDNIEIFLEDLINNIREMELLNEIRTK